jgi:hypothetical protein
MKTLKVVCMATVLALVLSVPAYAGDISTPGITTSGPITTSEPAEPGDTGTPGLTLSTSDQLDSADFFEFLITLVF